MYRTARYDDYLPILKRTSEMLYLRRVCQPVAHEPDGTGVNSAEGHFKNQYATIRIYFVD